MNRVALADTRQEKGRCAWCHCEAPIVDMKVCDRCKSRCYCNALCKSGHWGEGGHHTECRPAVASERNNLAKK